MTETEGRQTERHVSVGVTTTLLYLAVQRHNLISNEQIILDLAMMGSEKTHTKQCAPATLRQCSVSGFAIHAVVVNSGFMNAWAHQRTVCVSIPYICPRAFHFLPAQLSAQNQCTLSPVQLVVGEQTFLQYCGHPLKVN
jgi:hypothetical protein